MDRPVHLIVKLPYDRPPNAPRDPIPVRWTPQKEQFLWAAVSDARKADGSLEVDWPGLSRHLAVPLPYLLYRTQLRFEEELQGLRDVATLAPQLGGSQLSSGLQLYSTDYGNKPTRPVDPVRRVSNNTTPQALAIPSPYSRSGAPTAVPTPTRFATPAIPTPPRTATGRPPPGPGPSESTMTLTQRASMVPLNKAKPPPLSPPIHGEETETSSSSMEEPSEGGEPQLGQRLQDLAKLMSSGMLGFATQPRTPVPPEPEPEQRPFYGRPPVAPSAIDKGKGREAVQLGRSPSATPSGTVNPSPIPRGRQFPPSMISTATAKSQITASTATGPTDSRSHSQQHSSSSSISETRSGVGSIPSIASLPQSRSPTRSSSAVVSPVPSTGQSRSPSSASSPQREPPVKQQAIMNRHLKKLSLDAGSSSSASDAPPAAFGGRVPLRQPTRTRTSDRGGSAHGSTPSSFSDISDLSINSAMEEALMSNLKGAGISKLSMFGRSTTGNRASSYK